ncbi:hypothetical protein CRG98_026025 [Punica granatum]|uniref:Uncharacterized protein n=1 Tax=Punica granatum TaxID=22663 RepID=A0A2I0JBF6_PUNGR|nr:hypothetical protein CRG98_026025 [Punica granatum]
MELSHDATSSFISPSFDQFALNLRVFDEFCPKSSNQLASPLFQALIGPSFNQVPSPSGRYLLDCSELRPGAGQVLRKVDSLRKKVISFGKVESYDS